MWKTTLGEKWRSEKSYERPTEINAHHGFITLKLELEKEEEEKKLNGKLFLPQPP